MKLTALLLAFSLNAFSNESTENLNLIRAYNVAPCASWMMMRTEYNFAYGCANYPQYITLPDAYDVDRELTDLKKRVRELEGQIESVLNRIN